MELAERDILIADSLRYMENLAEGALAFHDSNEWEARNVMIKSLLAEVEKLTSLLAFPGGRT